MPDKRELRSIVSADLRTIQSRMNSALRGESLDDLESTLARLGQRGQLPYWYQQLQDDHTLPNLDGKTVGSVLEMLFVAVLENSILHTFDLPPLRVNPARGVDLPDLDLGVKSPSKNYCTSEPFFSAYERLLGSETDVVVLLTDYQTAKKTPPLRLQILEARYLEGSQVADQKLCRIMRDNRAWLLEANETWAKKVFRFLSFVNQSDWRGKQIVRLIEAIQSEKEVKRVLNAAESSFSRLNSRREKMGKEPTPESDLVAIQRINGVQPLALGVVDAADEWVAETLQDFGRLPNENEWHRLIDSPLNGEIGMSFALQWRYNFGPLFKRT